MGSETLLDDVPERQLRQACAELDRRLRAGTGGRAEELLAEFPALADAPDLAMELIYTEFCIREDLGESPKPEECYARFPHLRDRLQRLLQVHDQLGAAEAGIRLWSTEDVGGASGASRRSPFDRRSLAPARPEQRMLGEYELLEEIGRGGMGVVYKARQATLDRLVALKMILVSAQAMPDDLARLRHEAETLARLHHPNIVQIYHVDEQEGHAYFVMEYVAGGNLDEHMTGRPMPPRDAAQLVETLALAIHAAHQRGIVHCDLKPANILLQKDEGGRMKDGTEQRTGASFIPHPSSFVPKITDFGLARRLEGSSGLTKTGAILGTPSYMAPEQAAGKVKEIQPATDVYALGAVLYELLSGRPPFQAASPLDTLDQVRTREPISIRRLQSKVPRDLETICLKCLRKEAHKRYPSADALAEDLRRFLAGEAIRARPVGSLELAWRWCRRKPVTAGLMATLVVTLVVGLIVIASFGFLAQKRSEEARRERDEAWRQRAIAEDNYQQARQAVDAFAEVAGSKLFSQPGMQPLQRELLQSVLKYYEKFLQRREADPSLQTEVAKTYFRVAQISTRVGLKSDALRAARQACRIQEELVRAAVAVPDQKAAAQHQKSLAYSHKQAGYILSQMCRPDEALTDFRLADGIVRQLLAEYPGQPEQREHRELRQLLAQNLHDIGLLQWDLGELPEAQGTFEASRRILLQLAAKDPSDAFYRARLGFNLLSIGRIERESSKPTAARLSLEQARNAFAGLVETHDKSAGYLDGFSEAELHLGLLDEDIGDLGAAVARVLKAQEAAQRLVELSPLDADHRHALSSTHYALGRLRRKTGDAAAAIAELQKAQEIQASVALAHADEPKYRSYLGETLAERARTLLEMGETGAALIAAEDAAKQQGIAFRLAPGLLRHGTLFDEALRLVARAQATAAAPP